MRTNGKLRLAVGTVIRPRNMDSREMVSYAPMPSTDSTVCVGLACVAAVNAWITASVPARVDSANW